ncbi:MAG: MFS transporter [Myxococcales bacterium]|nr:MFS transporter [Myxococcales bacterium]
MTSLSVTERGSLHRFTEGLPRAYWFLWAGLLINRTGSFIVPLMTVYLTRERGLSLIEAGSILAMYGVGSIAGTTLGGFLADRLGRRATLLVSLVSSSLVMVATGQARELGTIAALVFSLGLTADLFRPASQALVADLVAPEFRVKAFGTQYWAINLGFAFAALVGGFVARSGFSVLFLADAATTLACAVIVYLGVPETRPERTPGQAGSLITPFFDRAFVPFLLLSYVTAFVFMQHLTSLPKDMTDKGLGPEAFGMALAANGVLIVLLQPLVLRAVTTGGRGRPLALGALITGIGFGLTAFAQALPMFVVSVAVWTLGEIVMAPVNSTVVADRAPAHLRGRYQGAFGLTWSLALVTAPVISPRLIAITGLTTFWGLCFVACAAASVGYLVALPEPARR